MDRVYEIVRREVLNDEIALIDLTTADGQPLQKPLPLQYITLFRQMTIDEKRTVRCYTILRHIPPGQPGGGASGVYRIAIKRHLPNLESSGVFTKWWFDGVIEGEWLDGRAPQGMAGEAIAEGFIGHGPLILSLPQ
jgi:ferredoxin-NADP reductase